MYAVGASSKEDKQAVLLCYYTDDAVSKTITVTFDFAGGAAQYEVFLLDAHKKAEKVMTVEVGGELVMEKNTVCLLKSI